MKSHHGIHIAALSTLCSAALLVTPQVQQHNGLHPRSTLGWVRRAMLPGPRTNAATAVGRDGNIYVFGGTSGLNEDYNTTYVYHPKTNSWAQGTTMPAPMEGGNAVTLPDGRIVVMGGGVGCHNTATCTIYRSVEAYTPANHSWRVLAAMHFPRYRFAATLGPDGRIYAIGGWNGKAAMANVEVYTPQTNTWGFATSLPQAEESAAATVTHHRIVVIGGYSGGYGGPEPASYFNDVLVYNGHVWDNGSPMTTPRSDVGVAVDAQGHIYAVGGYEPTRGYLATVEKYDPATDTWTKAAPLPRALSGVGAVSVGGHIYAIGGYYGLASTQVVELGPPAPHHNPFGVLT